MSAFRSDERDLGAHHLDVMLRQLLEQQRVPQSVQQLPVLLRRALLVDAPRLARRRWCRRAGEHHPMKGPTMLSTRSRDSLVPLALLAFLVVATLCLYSCVAHAAGVGPDPASTGGLDLGSILRLVADVGLGLGAVLGGVAAILHVIGARSRNVTVEAIADKLDAAHDKLDETVGTLRWIAPSAPAPTSPPAPPIAVVKPPSSGTAAMLAILLVGALAAPALTGCHTAAVQQVTSEGKAATAAVLDCEKKLAPGQLEQGLVLLAGDLASMVLAHGAIDWDALATAALHDASDVRACAIAEYHAVMLATAPPAATEAKLMSVNAPPVNALAAAVARIKAARSVTAILTPGGPI